MTRLALHWQIVIGMVFGATLGILLNTFAGDAVTVLSESLPDGIQSLEIRDSIGRTEFVLTKEDGATETLVVDPTAEEANSYRSFDEFKKSHGALHGLYVAKGLSPAHYWGGWFQRIGNLFLRMLKMVAVPLIITSLTTGVLGLGGAGGVGRMFKRTLLYYFATSMLAIMTGLLVVNVIRPGLWGANKPAQAEAVVQGSSGLGEVLFNQLEAMLPANPAAAIVAPDFLSIIAFTLAFAIFALRCGGTVTERVKIAAETGFEVMMSMTTAIIRLAPLGVFFLMMYVTATQGASVFKSLALYMLAVSSGLFIHAVITLPLIVWLVAKRNPWEFAKAMSPALLTAFSSASSNGTLPLTMSSVEQRAGVSNRTGSFVLPLGATINMDGTALYEAVAVLFIAQLYHGENLPLTAQLVVAFTALLASVGAAGIPHAGLVMMVIILQAVGLPVEMQGIILAVDRVLDMGRTSVNVWSDSCGCAVVDAFENPTVVETTLPESAPVAS